MCLSVILLQTIVRADNYNVVNTSDSGPGSLRQAILDANAHPNIDANKPDTISFAIPGLGVRTITPLTELPAITDALVIDGYTQPGASPNSLAIGDNAIILVGLNGKGATFNGLTITAGNSTVRGLAIDNFNGNTPGRAIWLNTNGNNKIEGCFIGTNPTGTAPTNNTDIIFLDHSNNNLIGGGTAAARNVTAAISISGDGSVTGQGENNVIQGNYVGIKPGAMALIPPGGRRGIGVNVLSGRKNSIIGNVIGGFDAGVELVSKTPASSENTVQGNFIGTNAASTAALPNGTGVTISTGDLQVTSDNLIGGPTPGARNVISGNSLYGVFITGNRNTIQGNFIGVGVDGSTPLPNGTGGIFSGPGFQSDTGNGNVIGGTIPGAGNVIAYNGVADKAHAFGVKIYSGTGNAILGNSIFGNYGLGINLGVGYGPIPNDSGDTNTGANNLQNFPVLASVSNAGGNTTIAGTLNSVANTTYRIEFFAGSGYGDGQTFVGSTDVTTDGKGDASFNYIVPQIGGSQRITMTATDPSGNTSEFSSAIGQSLNIATRLRVQTDDNVLIGGFIIAGTDPKRVIVRGIGPSLANSQVSGFLADPVLELHDASGATLETNDNWKTKSDGSSQQAEVEATTIPPTNDLEAAIVRTLPANGARYTAVLRGKSNATGIGVVEAYDLDQAANSSLANISTRGLVETGNNVLIGGFIAGRGLTKVVIRAIGPTLASSGVANPLQDPTLEMHDSSGVTIASNDNWKTKSDGSSQQAEIEATGIPPENDLESALVASLPPGNYTAIVRGKSNGTGVAVVEVYNLP